MIDLLNMLRYKSESTDIDFKSAQYRFNSGTEADKSELLKDILAIWGFHAHLDTHSTNTWTVIPR